VDDPLIFVRAVHFAATLSVTGVALFDVFVAQPVLRSSASPELRAPVVRRLAWIAWIGLALALLSGAAWFVLVSASISDQPLETVLSDASVLQAVLLDTDFGRDWLLRLLLIALLAGLLAADLREKQDSGGFLKLALVLVAAGLAGTLAWAGHGIGGAGLPGGIHLAADFVHLIAAAAWIGGLLRSLSCSQPRTKPRHWRLRARRACAFPLMGSSRSARSSSQAQSILGIWRAVFGH
jgi:copper resistance protein D